MTKHVGHGPGHERENKKRKLVRSAGATGELWTHKYNSIRSTATTGGDDGVCGNQPRDGFQRDTKLFKRGGMLQSKGSFHVREMGRCDNCRS
jgi:hypothetical protein